MTLTIKALLVIVIMLCVLNTVMIAFIWHVLSWIRKFIKDLN